jgi:hypothetical protein
VGFALVPPTEPELHLLHGWLDSWRGVGDIVVGMARQEYDLELRRYNGRGWRAMFVPSGVEHSFISQGTGQLCDVCEQAITADHLEYELDIGGRTLRFHDKCLDMWRQVGR